MRSEITNANLPTRLALRSQNPDNQARTALGSLHLTVVPTVNDALACRGRQGCLNQIALIIGVDTVGLGIQNSCLCQR